MHLTSDVQFLFFFFLCVCVWYGWSYHLCPSLTIILEHCSLTGNHTIEQLQEEFRTWDGELMVVFGFLFEVEDFILAKALG